LLLTIGALAQTGVNGSGWWSAIAVQHTDQAVTTGISVTMTGYAKHLATGEYDCGDRSLYNFGDGSLFYPHWSTQPGVDNCANDGTFPTSFEGSSILSADGDIRAVSQLSNISYGGWAPGDTPYGRAAGFYGGIVAPTTSIIYPFYKNDHSDEMTTFYIQNAGSSDTTLTAVFKPCSTCLGAGNVYTYTVSAVGAGKMVVIDPTLASGPSGSLPAGQTSYGGVTITSDSAPIAGVVLEHHKDASPATYLKSSRFFNANEANTHIYLNTVKYMWPDGTAAPTARTAKWSGVGIYNADTVQVTGNISFTLTGRDGDTNHVDVGTVYTSSFTIDPGNIGTVWFYNQGWANPPAGTQPGDIFSAEIIATGNIIGQNNEESDFMKPGIADLATYTSVSSADVATKISAPYYTENWDGKFGAFVVQNVSSSVANITVKIYVIDADSGLGASAGDTVWFTNSIPANENTPYLMSCFMGAWNGWTDVVGPDTKQMADLCDGYPPTKGIIGSVIIESDQDINVLASEEVGWWTDDASTGDGYGVDGSNYVGLPLP